MRLEVKYGLIGGGAFILWELGEYLFGFHDKLIHFLPLAGLLSIFVPFVVIFFGILKKRMTNPGGYMTLRDGLRTGLLIAIIMALVSGTYFYLYTSVINPGYIEARTEFMRESMEAKLLQKGNAESPEQARRLAVENTPMPSRFGSAMYYAMMRTSSGLLLALMISIFLKANPPKEFVEAWEKHQEALAAAEEEEEEA